MVDVSVQEIVEAMQAHGLPVDQALMEASYPVRNTDLASVSCYLKAILDRDPAQRPTAIVAGSLGRCMVISRVAPLLGIEIPGQLGVASIGSARMEGEGGPQLTGMLPDFEGMVQSCLDLLEQQRTKGRCNFTKLHVRMHFVEGHTLCHRPGREPGPGEREQGPEWKGDLQMLSRAVHY